MTPATWITCFRILLVPVFVTALIYYDDSGRTGAPVEFYRWLAVAAFLAAAISDAVDGWLARRFNQGSRLGAILDPLADKTLMLAALITLSFVSVPGLERFPIWFLALVLSRDAILVAGFVCLHCIHAPVQVKPHWTGKVATFLQMGAVARVLLDADFIPFGPLLWITAGFTFAALVFYLTEGIRLAHHPGTAPK
jgi:cardiolipin synthase